MQKSEKKNKKTVNEEKGMYAPIFIEIYKIVYVSVLMFIHYIVSSKIPIDTSGKDRKLISSKNITNRFKEDLNLKLMLKSTV